LQTLQVFLKISLHVPIIQNKVAQKQARLQESFRLYEKALSLFYPIIHWGNSTIIFMATLQIGICRL
jgi:hypothetical protein